MDSLNNLITDFSIDKLEQFFRQKISTFKPDEENYEYLFEDNENIIENYEDIEKIGEADINNSDDLIIITAKTIAQLTNRTGKKRQFEIAKRILKEENKDAAFFVFYDENGNFRFSLIRANFHGSKKDFTDFKRYTYYVSREFTNKTFKAQISKADFNDLNSIQEAFSVEPLTKQFYEKLQHWYFWAIDNVKFPDDAEEEKNGREIAVIRLITRLMFIWFMKVRDLIPDDLFIEDNIKKILEDSDPEESTYYKAILQNLFFATLNTKQEDRKFRCEERYNKGYNPDFGNQNLFRYHDLFKDSESLKILFEKIPFLNGGLFECLDYKPKGGDKDERKYIDGFTATKGKQPKVPNFLFFSEIQKKDISKFYGKKNNTYEVEGLINLLKSFNFTIDENEADDIEVALDPELLGSIFENLLASYNPETATTARKATGSFYTPREIVNYMTNESLKQYFITHLKTDIFAQTELENKLDSLIKSNNLENPFNTETSQKITKLINDLRVVDPSVGSGAFPMAVLNKLVFILSKIDPDNTFWKNSQINGVKKAVSDPVLLRKLIEHIERQFNEKNADYGRKLYLIEKCIYGVDIQQIAVEIAKLRFFISLLVDEKIDFDNIENNYGIEALPNLDFKLMQGNSLISELMGISFDFDEKEKINLIIEETKEQLVDVKNKQKKIESIFFKIYNTEKRQDEELNKKLKELAKTRNKLEKELKQLYYNSKRNNNEHYKLLVKQFEELKNEYQNEADKENKDQLRDKIEKIILTIFDEKMNQHIPQLKNIEEKYSTLPNRPQREKAIAEDKQKLTKNLGFDIEQIEKDLIAYTEGRKSKDFFLWDVYFAEVFSGKGGFDIVIGNPPYIQLQKAINGNEKFADLYKNEIYETFERTGDIYTLFYEKGINILSENGLLCYITSNKWMRANYGKSLRKFFSTKNPLRLIDLGPGVFNTATVDTNILLIENFVQTHNRASQLKALTLTNKEKINALNNEDFISLTNLSEDSLIILSPEEQKIKLKIEHIGTPLKDWDISIYRGVLTGFNEAFIIDGKTKDELIAKDFKSAEIIKPILRGRDIKRYKAEFADLWLISTFPALNLNINDYSAVKEYLEQFLPKIKQIGETYIDENGQNKKTRKKTGNKWFETQDQIAYYKEFEKEKIVWKRIGSVIRFSYSEIGEYCLDSTVIAVGNNVKYLTALLNSKLHIRELLINSPKTGTGDVIISVQALTPLLVHLPNDKGVKSFEAIVDKIISKKQSGEDTKELEDRIDLMVYKLYNLTYEEVKIIEPEFEMSKDEYENYGK